MAAVTLDNQPLCGLTGDDYARVLADLLPRGAAWPRDPDATIMLAMRGLAEEWARWTDRNCDLLAEAYPCGATESIEDWERICGLPDPCTGPLATLQQRRIAVCAALAATGGSSEQYFIELAAALGYSITIETFEPFRVETNTVEQPLYDESWMFAWRITVAGGPHITYFRVDVSTVEEPLEAYSHDQLLCLFAKLKPAHTVIIWDIADESDWDNGASIWDSGASIWDQAPDDGAD
jgi:uncharacterized protein YmfQ (DUF2313 family)